MYEQPQKVILSANKTESNLWALQHLAFNQHTIVATTDMQGKITYVNDLFCEASGYTDDELIGQTHQIVNSGQHDSSFFHEMFDTLKDHGLWRGEICNKRKDGALYWVETTIAALRDDDDKPNGYIVMCTDVSEQHRTLEAMRRLHDITAARDTTLDEKINSILTLGCEIFHLPIGIVSSIHLQNNEYTVIYSCTPANEISPGDNFPLGNTYCSDTVRADKPVSHHHVGQSDMASHPAYAGFGLESYIGAPIITNGLAVGTINFSGPAPRARAFGNAETELIQLFSQWISDEFDKHDTHIELERQRMLLNAVSDQARIGAWELDVESQDIYWSDVTRKIHEVSEDFTPDLTNAIQFYRDDSARDKISSLVESAMETGTAWSVELPLITAKKKPIWVLARGEPIFSQGKCVKLFGSFQDITQERKDKALQLAQAQRHQLMVESTAVGFWDHNINSGHSNLSERWAEIIGYELHELEPISSDTWKRFCHPDDLKESERKIEDYLQGKSSNYECTARMKHKMGHWVWVLDTGKIVERDDHGKPLRIIGTRMDITDSKTAQAELYMSHQRIRVATESAGISIWEYNIETGEVAWDKGMYDLYGIKEDKELSFNDWESTLHPDDHDSAVSAIQIAINESKPFHQEFRICTPDNEVKHIRAASAIIKNEHGYAQMMVGINIDITKETRNASALMSAKKEAEAATKAKSDFLATMSHEIRTPMNGVLGMLSLLKNTQLTDDQLNRVRIAQNSAQSLLALINDILDFSKIEANKLELETITFDINQVMVNCAESLANMADDKGIELIVDSRHLVQPMVKGDPSRVRQIMTNLISNAVKFTNTGEVTISLKQTLQNTDWLIDIAVQDTGVGIPNDKIPYLFHAFNQLDSSTTREFGGTGLGLAIVSNLCKRMKGDVSVESEPNKGSCFTATITLDQAIEAETEALNLNGINIFIIEHNQAVREHLSTHLTELGATVTCSSNGTEAADIAISSNDSYDLMLLDNNIPGEHWRDSASALAHLTALDTALRLLIVPVSFRDTDRFIESGDIHAQVFKPVDVLELAKQIKNPNDLKSTSSRVSPTNNRTKFNGRHVLLVEDNRVNQLVAEEMLTAQGLSVDIAENGQKALDLLLAGQHKYELIFMDCQMPVMDGYDATRAIRSGQAGTENQSLPIIAMTAHAMTGDKERCLASGMNDYLAKPVDPSQMLDILTLWVPPQETTDSDSHTNNANATHLSIPKNIHGIWDKSKALTRVMGNEQLLHQLIDMFRSEQPLRLQEMRSAIAENNFDHLRDQAHCLKGVAGNLGLDAIQRIAAQMDQDIRTGKHEQCREHLDELYTETERFVTAYDNSDKMSTNGDTLNLRHELLSISNALNQNDYISQKSLDFMLKTYGDAVLEEQLTQLARDITAFENAKAQTRLKVLLDQLNGNNNDT